MSDVQTKPKRTRIGRLKNPSDVSKLMSKVIKQALRPGGDTVSAYRMVQSLSLLLRAFEATDLEARISRIEKRLGD